ncbi:nitrogenase molybdenum-iron protein beta chain [Natronobacillus azotifigens]|uniref:Nitrogenase molybdenum-iron protein beta chain n=1 Tax=Natronobacillus azotifigens TaxID=472978 RepID=A0A9J6RE48_9BACI|nr:nitrogenase molybdenum-iron protein subunit beta [Natronobacillus azotifigens]MCZ0703741.1 nitrogenase molybdenum-iron protein subunit beta [Natronobacillus azotifigens]
MDKSITMKDHNTLFQEEKYVKQAENKKQFEAPCSNEEIEMMEAYLKTDDYKKVNFNREAATINPNKACQPLGAVLAALGFEGTLPYVHGSQGCVAYFRSHFARHFKEPVPAVSSSMTEDGAVFGGMRNLIEGLENCQALYNPKMIAISTTCMAEVIGDDLGAFIENAKKEEVIDSDFPLPYANTPSFVGSHNEGYDNMMRAILSHLSEKDNGLALKQPSDTINIIPGYDTYTGNFSEIKHILETMNVGYTILGDHSGNLDSPANGEYHYFYGGTKLIDVQESPSAKGTMILQKYSTRKTAKYIEDKWEHAVVSTYSPIGIKATDQFVSQISELTGVKVPQSLIDERGRVVDAFTDSQAYLHGKRVALSGDPDVLLGLISFCLEVGIEPVHIICTNGNKQFQEEAEELLKTSPYGAESTVYAGKDLWHLRSLLLTNPVDFAIGNTNMKYATKDANIPLVRIGFPIFDRHHMHRYPIIGYQGALNVLTMIVNTILQELDEQAPDYSYDAVR